MAALRAVWTAARDPTGSAGGVPRPLREAVPSPLGNGCAYPPKKKSISSWQLLHGSGSSNGSGNGAPGTTT